MHTNIATYIILFFYLLDYRDTHDTYHILPPPYTYHYKL